MVFKLALLQRRGWLRDNGYTFSEEVEIYDEVLCSVLLNVRWYLDNLDDLREFRVRWGDYRSGAPVVPYRFVLKPKVKTKHL